MKKTFVVVIVAITVMTLAILSAVASATTDTVGDTSYNGYDAGAGTPTCTYIIASNTGTLTSLGMNFGSGMNNLVGQMAIFTDNSNSVHTLLANTSYFTMTAGFNDYNTGTATITSGQKYWVCFNRGAGAAGANPLLYGKQTVTNARIYYSSTFGTWNNDPAGQSLDNYIQTNFRMTYTLSALPPLYSANTTSIVSPYDAVTLSVFNVTWQNQTDQMYNSVLWSDIYNPAGMVGKSMTQISQSGNLTTYGFADILPAGTYWFYMKGNTTGNQQNQTLNLTFTVASGTPPLSITLNTSQNINLGLSVKATGTGCPTELTCVLELDNITKSNPDSETPNYGSYYFEYLTGGSVLNLAGALNWTAQTYYKGLSVSQPDPITQTLLNPYALTIITSLMFSAGIIFIGAVRTKKVPVELFLLNFVLFLGFFIQIIAGVSSQIILVVILGVGALGTFLANKLYIGEFAGESKIFLSYITFFAIAFFFINYTALNSNLFGVQQGLQQTTAPTPTQLSQCTNSSDIIAYIFNYPACALRSVSQSITQPVNQFLSLFSISFGNGLGIINDIMILPFGYFIAKYFLDYIRGRGSS